MHEIPVVGGLHAVGAPSICLEDRSVDCDSCCWQSGRHHEDGTRLVHAHYHLILPQGQPMPAAGASIITHVSEGPLSLSWAFLEARFTLTWTKESDNNTLLFHDSK